MLFNQDNLFLHGSHLLVRVFVLSTRNMFELCFFSNHNFKSVFNQNIIVLHDPVKNSLLKY